MWGLCEYWVCLVLLHHGASVNEIVELGTWVSGNSWTHVLQVLSNLNYSMEKTCSYYQGNTLIPNSLDHFVRSWWNFKSRSDFCLLVCAIKIISSDRRFNKALFKLCHLKCSAGVWGGEVWLELAEDLTLGWDKCALTGCTWNASPVTPGKCVSLEP